jgi:hypothetical protein
MIYFSVYNALRELSTALASESDKPQIIHSHNIL